ncbi:MAG: PilZ domain-containing protein [Planctomycetota bacterium]
MTREQRRHKRYSIKGLKSRLCTSRFFGLLVKPTSEEYICLDISESGLQFITKKLLTQNKLLLDVTTPFSRDKPIRIKCRVAWFELSLEFDIYMIGVEFVSLGKAQRDKLKMLIEKIGEDKDQIPQRVRVQIIKRATDRL